MADSRHKAYTQSIATASISGIASLATNTMSSASTAIDNTTNLDPFLDVEVFVDTQGSARGSGAVVELYVVRSIDGGSNYERLARGVTRPAAVWQLDAATTATRLVECDIPIPPGFFQIAVFNATGQAFAGSTAVRYRTHKLEVV